MSDLKAQLASVEERLAYAMQFLAEDFGMDEETFDARILQVESEQAAEQDAELESEQAAEQDAEEKGFTPEESEQVEVEVKVKVKDGLDAVALAGMARAEEEAGGKKRKPGRPKGSLNKPKGESASPSASEEEPAAKKPKASAASKSGSQ